jgi:hypothetical protein
MIRKPQGHHHPYPSTFYSSGRRLLPLTTQKLLGTLHAEREPPRPRLCTLHKEHPVVLSMQAVRSINSSQADAENLHIVERTRITILLLAATVAPAVPAWPARAWQRIQAAGRDWREKHWQTQQLAGSQAGATTAASWSHWTWDLRVKQWHRSRWGVDRHSPGHIGIRPGRQDIVVCLALADGGPSPGQHSHSCSPDSHQECQLGPISTRLHCLLCSPTDPGIATGTGASAECRDVCM